MSKLNIKYMVQGMISTNVFLVQNTETKEVFIIDPADGAAAIADAVRGMDGRPVAILLTHGHFDHILAAEELKKEFQIPIIANAAEQEVLAITMRDLPNTRGLSCHVSVDRLVNEGDVLDLAGFSVHVLHTPGHTKGSTCYYIPEEKVLFAGDTIFCGSYGRTDLPTGDQGQIEKSVARLLAELPDDVTICPGHESFTTVEFEKKYNPLRPRE